VSFAFQPAFQRAGFAFQQELAAAATDEPSGGWIYHAFALHREARRRRKEREEEAKREADEIQAEIDREIARLLREQEARDAERADLARIQSIADQYAGTRQQVPKNISIAMLKAYEERSRNALEQLRREIDRMLEEEELAVMVMLLNDD
jgi:hypothetical protein